MSAIFKVGFNVIYTRHQCAGLDQEPGKQVGWESLDGDWEDGDALPDTLVPITRGDCNQSETVSADDAEGAIKIVRSKVVGQRKYDKIDWLEDGETAPEGANGEWMCRVVRFIQIVRVEPVAFTTI